MDPEIRLNRKEAAKYLTEIGIPISPKTLRNMAAHNGNNGKRGPPCFHILTRTVYYLRSELDTWAASNKRRIE